MCACAVTFKVVTLGESRVGKTSLVLRFSRDTFDTQEPSTIGVSYVPITMSHGDSNVKLQIWDTCGQELYASLLTSYYRDAAAALLVYDVCTPHSFSRMQAWANEIRDKAPSNMVVTIAGNKIDLREAKVPRAQAERFAREIGAELVFTSAKTGEGVREAFHSLGRRVMEKLTAGERIGKLSLESATTSSQAATVGRRLHMMETATVDQQRRSCSC